MLVDAREKLHIPWGDPDNKAHGDTLMAFDTRTASRASGQVERAVFMKYLPSIQALWADSGIQSAYDRRREFQLVSNNLPALHPPPTPTFMFIMCVSHHAHAHGVHMCVWKPARWLSVITTWLSVAAQTHFRSTCPELAYSLTYLLNLSSFSQRQGIL